MVNNEHLTEALRRLRKSSSDSNVDRRLVTNILLSFLGAKRGDSKRFEMLNILATILSWDDVEREKAGLQRVGTGSPASGAAAGERPKMGRKGSEVEGRSAEEEAAMNEVCCYYCCSVCAALCPSQSWACVESAGCVEGLEPFRHTIAGRRDRDG